MKAIDGTTLCKRSVVLHGHATSVALEVEFWRALDGWAEEEGMSCAQLIAAIDRSRDGGGASLASAVRVAVLSHALHHNGRRSRAVT